MYPVGERAGWITTQITQSECCGLLEADLATGSRAVRQQTAAAGLPQFVRDGTGDVLGASGAHDDTVMAMAIALVSAAICAPAAGAKQPGAGAGVRRPGNGVSDKIDRTRMCDG